MSEKAMENEKTAQVLQREVRTQIIGYVLTAFGLIAGLAWNDAIKSLIEHIFPLSQNSVWAKLGYALILSIAVGVISFNLVKWTKK